MEELLLNALYERNSPEEIKNEGEIYRLLGFIDWDDDYAEVLAALYRNHAAGFYSTSKKNLVLSSRFLGEVSSRVLAHELTHGLQDQHFGIDKLLHSSLTTDEALARSALLEGDANTVMEALQQRLDCKALVGRAGIDTAFHEEEFSALSSQGAGLRILFHFPYHYGTRYVCKLLQSGGKKAVDEAFRRPPCGTTSLLHGAGATCGRAQEVDLQGIAAADTIGEFAIFALLAREIGIEHAARAAAGWRFDRALLVEGNDSLGTLEWITGWSSEEEAKEFADALGQYLSLRFASLPRNDNENSSLITGANATASLTRRGSLTFLSVVPHKKS